MTGKGPNDASGVVWALGEWFLKKYSCFFIVINVLCMYIRYNLRNTQQGGRTRAARTEEGPNNAERVRRRLSLRLVIFFF